MKTNFKKAVNENFEDQNKHVNIFLSLFNELFSLSSSKSWFVVVESVVSLCVVQKELKHFLEFLVAL